MDEASTAEPTGLRHALRAHTADVHRRLDTLVGTFETLEDYQSFLVRSYSFRQVAEAACADSILWSPLRLLPDILLDLADLRIPVPPTRRMALNFLTPSEFLGACYVLEGSALGARLLLREAAKLGLSAGYGARHLAHQSGDHARWKSFLAVLDRREIDRAEALHAAQRLFEAALAVYSEKSDAYA
jgi:heme oxygenase